VALPAFARRTPRCCAPCSNRLVSPAGRGNRSKSAAAGLQTFKEFYLQDGGENQLT